MIGVNVRGVWLGCKYVLPEMNNGGSIIAYKKEPRVLDVSVADGVQTVRIELE